jgi:hypothetical protein
LQVCIDFAKSWLFVLSKSLMASIRVFHSLSCLLITGAAVEVVAFRIVCPAATGWFSRSRRVAIIGVSEIVGCDEDDDHRE